MAEILEVISLENLTASEAELEGDRLLAANHQQEALEFFQHALKFFRITISYWKFRPNRPLLTA